MNEASIQALHESDWADFNSDRRFQEHQTSLLDYMEFLLAESEAGKPEDPKRRGTAEFSPYLAKSRAND